MHRVSIVYFSQAGTTALLAEAIGRGARADENVDVALLRIRPESIHEGRWQDDDTLHALADSDTIVFGAPTYMGGGARSSKHSLMPQPMCGTSGNGSTSWRPASPSAEAPAGTSSIP